jgi:hypothetical protein
VQARDRHPAVELPHLALELEVVAKDLLVDLDEATGHLHGRSLVLELENEKPPMTSFDSVKGPSVTLTSPAPG